MLNSSTKRFAISIFGIFLLGFLAFQSKAFLVLVLGLMGIAGWVILLFWLYDWCKLADEDLFAARCEIDRQRARQTSTTAGDAH